MISRTTSVQWIAAFQIIKLRLTRISTAHVMPFECTVEPVLSKVMCGGSRASLQSTRNQKLSAIVSGAEQGAVQMTTTATARAEAPVASAAQPAKTQIRPPKALPAPNSDFYQ